MKKRIITALPALLLCGCQLVPQPPAGNAPSATNLNTPPKTSLQLTQLWMEGDLAADTPLPVAAIRADSDRVTFNWNGDAVELLNARHRGAGRHVRKRAAHDPDADQLARNARNVPGADGAAVHAVCSGRTGPSC